MIEGSYQGFDVALGDGVGVLTFGHPERLNAISPGTKRDLCQVLTLAQFDDDLRVLVLTGTGRAFVAGTDNARANPEPPTLVPEVPMNRRAQVNLYSRLHQLAQEPVRAMRRLDKCTIAAVNGFAIHLGLSLALAADVAVAGRAARFGSATLRMGWQPDEGGHWLLVERLGTKGALDFLLRKRVVDADEALRLGLVDEVVDDDVLAGRALEIATELADGPQAELRLLKRATYNAAAMTFDQAADDIATKTAIAELHQEG
jgi:2-(1,2-epoxy-1,2-dihydrophenyl)acetyl-CoA isomerase